MVKVVAGGKGSNGMSLFQVLQYILPDLRSWPSIGDLKIPGTSVKFSRH